MPLPGEGQSEALEIRHHDRASGRSTGEKRAAYKVVWRMIEADAIRRRARQDLAILTAQGQEDVRLWEHSLRVTLLAERLLAIPEVAGQRVDRIILNAVGLYHEAGWWVQLRDREIEREALLTRPTSPLQRDLAAVMAENCLREILPRQVLDTVTTAIRLLGDRDVDIIEARLIAEADSLEEFGAPALWRLARKSSLEGKGVVAAIETWATQKQYGYWTARINDSFRFDSVRRMAQERLRVLDRLFRDLKAHHQGDDVAEWLNPRLDKHDEGRLPSERLHM